MAILLVICIIVAVIELKLASISVKEGFMPRKGICDLPIVNDEKAVVADWIYYLENKKLKDAGKFDKSFKDEA